MPDASSGDALPRTESIAVHGPGHRAVPGQGLALDITPSVSFHLESDAGFSAHSRDDDGPPTYSRWSNPTVRFLERHLAALEGAEDAVCFGSGMAAVSGLLLSQLSPGDHLIASNICYAGVAELLHEQLSAFGVDIAFIDTSDVTAVAAALRPDTRLIFIETPANPLLRLTDIREMARCAASVNARLAVDSTFATPIATRPIELGADFVIHSLTKYACGHGDALGGAVLGRRDAMSAIRTRSLVHYGAVLHPFPAWLIDRSLHTLPLRMRQHEANAIAVARFLEDHPRVERVIYPGSPTHPQYALARRQMANFSGMIAFRASDVDPVRNRLASEAKLISYAVSLGKTKSLVVYVDTSEVQEHSFRLDAAELAKYREWAGDGIFRLSVGIEAAGDIIEDLDRALR